MNSCFFYLKTLFASFSVSFRLLLSVGLNKMGLNYMVMLVEGVKEKFVILLVKWMGLDKVAYGPKINE